MKRSAWRYLWAAKDIRNKLLITLFILVIYRFAAHVPVPGVNVDAIAGILEAAEIDGTARGETLSFVELDRLTQACSPFIGSDPIADDD